MEKLEEGIVKKAKGLNGDVRVMSETEYKKFIGNKVAFYSGNSVQTISNSKTTLKCDYSHYLVPKSYGIRKEVGSWGIETKSGNSVWRCKNLYKTSWNKRNSRYYVTKLNYSWGA